MSLLNVKKIAFCLSIVLIALSMPIFDMVPNVSGKDVSRTFTPPYLGDYHGGASDATPGMPTDWHASTNGWDTAYADAMAETYVIGWAWASAWSGFYDGMTVQYSGNYRIRAYWDYEGLARIVAANLGGLGSLWVYSRIELTFAGQTQKQYVFDKTSGFFSEMPIGPGQIVLEITASLSAGTWYDWSSGICLGVEANSFAFVVNGASLYMYGTLKKVVIEPADFNIADVTLTSRTTDGKMNVGQIRFDGTLYSYLPKTVEKRNGIYSAEAIYASNCYEFDKWETSGAIGVTNPYSQVTQVTVPNQVNNDGTLRAVYKLKKFRLIIQVSPSGWGTTNPSPGTYTYDCCTEVTVKAYYSCPYFFDHWLLDGKNAGSNWQITVHMDQDHTLTAVFGKRSYRLTIQASPPEGGTTNPSPGTYTYDACSDVTVTATANPCYSFDHWELDGSPAGTSPSITVHMDRDHTLKAVFKKYRYQLTIQVSPLDGGTTNPSPGTYDYDCCSSVTVTATANPCYSFDHWELDGSPAGTSPSITVHMDRDHTLKTVFAILPIDVVVADVELPYTHLKLYANITYVIGVNITNLGSGSAATFNASLELFWLKGGIRDCYAEKTVAELGPGASTIVYFHVKITHVSNYVLNATADCNNDIAESNETNNSMAINIDGRLAGDLDGDKDVDFDDIVTIAMAYGSDRGDPNWNEQADLDADSDVDFDDVVIASMNYGRKAEP